MKRSKVDLKTCLNDSNFLKPGSITAKRLKTRKVIYKFSDSFKEKTENLEEFEDFTWKKNFDLKNSLVSASFNRKELYKLETSNKRIRKTLENTVKSVKNDKDPSLNQKTSVLDTSTDILNSKSYNSLNLYSKPENCGLGTDLMQNAVFYRIRPSFKIKTMKKKSANSEKKTETGLGEIKESRSIKSVAQFHRSYTKLKKIKTGKPEIQPKFPEFPAFKSNSSNCEEKINGSRLFSKTKNKPLYQVSLQNNFFIRLRKLRGKLE